MDVIRFMTMWKTDVKGQDLNSWEEFEEKLKELETVRQQNPYASKFLFRGQSNSEYGLLTTLERSGNGIASLAEYHQLILKVLPQIETFMGQRWDVLSVKEHYQLIIKKGFFGTSFLRKTTGRETYSYMAYLRHYGFPSPLLDWTASAYVAAYFAFREKTPKNTGSASIYIYLDTCTGGAVIPSTGPLIREIEQYVRTDKRHFLQQSRYTICIVKDGGWRYARHEEKPKQKLPKQNSFWKFNIPGTEREKVLKNWTVTI